MRGLCLFAITCAMLAACGGSKHDAGKSNAGTDSTQLTARDTTVRRAYVADTIVPYAIAFRPTYGWQHIDTLIYDCLQQPGLDTLMRSWALGDGSGIYTRYTCHQTNTTVLLDADDGGEYGYRNSYYYLRADSVVAYRIFDKSIKEFPTKNTPTVFKLREEIYYYDTPGPRAQYREMLTTNGNDSTLNEIGFKPMVADTGNVYTNIRRSYDAVLERHNIPGLR